MSEETSNQKEDLNEVMRNRRDKLEQIKNLGINPYPYSFKRSHFSVDITQNTEDFLEKEVQVSGRLMSKRGHGKTSFAHIMDSKGRIQLYVRKDQISELEFELFGLLDIGDIIGIKGEVFVTRTGETTVKAKKVELLSKTLRPLPIVKEKQEGDGKVLFDQFVDKELRYRQRYVDLIVNPEVRDIFVTRSKVITKMRRFFDDLGFLEVETPVLQPIYGGASARPFVTHHNALAMELTRFSTSSII